MMIIKTKIRPNTAAYLHAGSLKRAEWRRVRNGLGDGVIGICPWLQPRLSRLKPGGALISYSGHKCNERKRRRDVVGVCVCEVGRCCCHMSDYSNKRGDEK